MKTRLLIAVLLALSYAGCNSSHDHENEHAEESAKIQYTAYSDAFEVFAEADPFVTGQPCGVLAHFSKLPSFRALEDGSITIRLITDGKEHSQTLDEPTRKGIFSFTLEPGTEGEAEIRFDITTADGKYSVLVPGVRVFVDEEEAHQYASGMQLSATNAFVFTKEQSWKTDFRTELPKIEPFGQVIRTSARVQPSQGEEAMLTAKASGIVMLNSGNILEGESVSAGQVLLSIKGSGLAENNMSVRYAEAKNKMEQTKSEYERLKELAADRIVSEKELRVARNEYENAKVVFESLEKGFTASGQTITSPLKGYIRQVYVSNGQYVEAGQVLLNVSGDKTLLLRADVEPRHLDILPQLSSAVIRTPHNDRTYTLEEVNGKLLSFGRSVNEDNFMIPLTLQIDNKGGFIPGAYVDLFLKATIDARALTIPNAALLEEQGNFYVFVQITPELFEKRAVIPGGSDGLRTAILGGIGEGDRIVSQGAILIKLAQATGTLDAHSGHVH